MDFDILDRMTSFLAGKRTYLVAIVTGLVAAAQAMGWAIPEWVMTALIASGLYYLRAGVTNNS